jgi:uncharacterized protein
VILGVISDTHGLLRPEAEAALAGVDHIVHAGDIGDPGILPRLARIAPVTAIRGNVDVAAWAADLPAIERATFGGAVVVVVHALNDLPPAEAEGAAMVVFGHSHRPEIRREGGVLFLNPGSAGPRRFRLPVTLATVAIGPGGIDARLRHLAP